MNKLLLILLLAIPFAAQAQTGAMMPSIYPVFTNLNGVNPVARGFVCTEASGTSNAIFTYLDSNLVTPNQNPITLNQSGRAVNGTTLVPIFLSATQYRITLYAAGTGNTCNGADVGSLIWQQDHVYDLAQLIGASVVVQVLNCATEGGATAGDKLWDCIHDLPATGGVADARGFQGSGNDITRDIFAGANGPVQLLLGAATFRTTTGQRINYSGTQVIGLGPGVTVFKFNPSGAGTLLTVQAATAVAIANIQLSNFTLDATGNTSQVKKGIVVNDAEEMEISDVSVSNWHDTTNLSEGIEINGRQTFLGARLTVAADKPFRIGKDANTSVVAADHFHFKDIYTIVGTGAVPTIQNPNWTIDNGVFLTNVTWDGYQAWVAGRYGILWNDTTSTMPSYNVSINNVRWEQDCPVIPGCVANNGYALSLTPSNLQFNWALTINNLVTDSFHNGILIRNFYSGSLTNSFIDGLLDSLNVDSTVSIGVMNNVFNLTSGAFLSTTGFIPTMWCGNDSAPAGQTTPRCGHGVVNPTNYEVIPNNQSFAGLNNAGNAEVAAIGISGITSHVMIGSGGTAAFTAGPLTVGADLPVGSSSKLVIPNGITKCLGGENAAGNDSYPIGCIDGSNNIVIGLQAASNHTYTTSPTFSFGGDVLTGNTIFHGSGSPNGAVTGIIGDIYVNGSGGAGTTLYMKESGASTNTGWVGYAGGAGISQTLTVRNSAGSGTCTITVVVGLITGTTC